jgi:putative transposase
VSWYNDEHRHSGIRYVTPNQRHEGKDKEILELRKKVYQAAKIKNPERWSKDIRNWGFIDYVELNPEVKSQAA